MHAITMFWMSLTAVGILSLCLLDVRCADQPPADNCSETTSGPGKKVSVSKNCTTGEIHWINPKQKLSVYFLGPPPHDTIPQKRQFWNVCVTGGFHVLASLGLKPGKMGTLAKLALPTPIFSKSASFNVGDPVDVESQTHEAPVVCSKPCLCKKGQTLVLFSTKGIKYEAAAFHYNITSVDKYTLFGNSAAAQKGVTPIGR